MKFLGLLSFTMIFVLSCSHSEKINERKISSIDENQLKDYNKKPLRFISKNTLLKLKENVKIPVHAGHNSLVYNESKKVFESAYSNHTTFYEPRSNLGTPCLIYFNRPIEEESDFELISKDDQYVVTSVMPLSYSGIGSDVDNVLIEIRRLNGQPTRLDAIVCFFTPAKIIEKSFWNTKFSEPKILTIETFKNIFKNIFEIEDPSLKKFTQFDENKPKLIEPSELES